MTRLVAVAVLAALLTACGGGSGSARSGGSASGGRTLRGSYVAGTEDDGLSIQFQPGRKVEVRRAGDIVSSYGYYKIEGDKVNVTIPGGESMVLTIKGTTLEGTVGGRAMRFVRG